ncbi:MAG: glycosyltransferase family 2 protein [Flavobacteriales bacterium]|nr:glycosyltransferase family 2 protein [Flavobacteriales bacterium]
MDKVAIVILNWNGKEYLQKFLPSVVNHSRDIAKVYVADNASTDDSIDFVKQNYPEIGIIINDKNYGFAKGYNEALKKIKAQYYVLLNSDVEVSENWIQPIIDLMDNDETISACQPKIKDYNRKNHFEYAGAAGGFIDYLGYPLCRGRIFNNLEEDKGQYDDVCEIFWATGAAMFVRASIFNELEGLDEHFFAHMEEIDLCWRMKNSGYKIMYCPASVVYHVGGGTLNKINPKKTYLNFRNNLFLLHKNLPKKDRFRIILQRLFLDGLAGIKLFFEGKPKHTLAIIKAHFHFYGDLKQNKRKRLKKFQPNYVGMLYKNTLFLSFFRGKQTFTEIVNS